MMTIRTLIAVVAALLVTVSALAQSDAMINVHVVELPVTVLDSAGNPVRGLTGANFVLYDEKMKTPITSFDAIDFAAREEVSAISPLNAAARRSFVLVFDLSFTSPRAMARAQEAARRFVKESVGPRDRVAVTTVDVDRGFRFVTAFTTDRQLVASAIGNPANFRGTDPLQLANQTQVWSAGEPIGAEPAMPPPEGNAALAEEHLRDLAQLATAKNIPAVRQRIERELDTLGNLARAMRAVPGRKQAIFLSEGFDPRILQGGDARDTKDQQKRNDQILTGDFSKIDQDTVFGSTSTMTILDRMAANFRASDVVLQAIDIQGVRVQNNIDEGSIVNSNASLFLLARPTGGEVFQNSNDLSTDFARLLRQQEVVYILGFHVPDGTPGAFHTISIKLVNVPAGTHVLHRPGYYEPGVDSPVERALTNAEIIVNDIPQHELHLNMLAAPFPPAIDAKVAQVPVIIEINGADLVRQTSATIGGADIFVYAFDSEGVVRDRLYRSITFEIAKLGEKVRTAGIRYYGTLMLPPGTYAVKALVRTGDPERGAAGVAEKRGFARINIAVPASGQTAILPLIPIGEDERWLFVRGDRGESPAYPFEFAGRNFIPTATADLSGGARKVALFVFGAHPSDLTMETSPQTKVLAMTDTGGATKVVLQLDSADGASSLDVTIHKKGVDAAQRVSVPLM
jgi:VWFA-related protein